MMKLLEEQRQINPFHFISPTAVIASIGPGSIVSNDSYNNLPMIHIVRTKVLIHPEFVNTKYGYKYGNNNKSGIVRTILRTNVMESQSTLFEQYYSHTVTL